MTTTIVVIGGDMPAGDPRPRLPVADHVIAADSGLDTARAWGLQVGRVIGDLDSVSPVALAEARRSGTVITSYPRAKDATDAELALEAALATGADHLVVVGGVGPRLDHCWAAMAALCHPDLRRVRVEAWFGSTHLWALQGPDELDLVGVPGDLVSLMAVGGPAGGVSTTGLVYRLDHDTLTPFSSRGVSNEFCAPNARVSITTGALVVIVPHEPGSTPS